MNLNLKRGGAELARWEVGARADCCRCAPDSDPWVFGVLSDNLHGLGGVRIGQKPTEGTERLGLGVGGNHDQGWERVSAYVAKAIYRTMCWNDCAMHRNFGELLDGWHALRAQHLEYLHGFCCLSIFVPFPIEKILQQTSRCDKARQNVDQPLGSAMVSIEGNAADKFWEVICAEGAKCRAVFVWRWSVHVFRSRRCEPLYQSATLVLWFALWKPSPGESQREQNTQEEDGFPAFGHV